jgi:hypothetical protein
MKLLTVASRLDNEGLDNLIKSSEKFGWNIEIVYAEWRGFGTKLIEVYNFFYKNPNVKEVIFVDAYDVLVLSTPQEVKEKIKDRSKILISTEKNCWPQSDLSFKYPDAESEWKYINSGTYYAPRDLFMDLIEKHPPLYSDDDQLWMTTMFLSNRDKFVLDYDCEVFQCHSFVAEDDYEYKDKRVFNLKTKSKPVLIHFNGKSDNAKVLELL